MFAEFFHVSGIRIQSDKIN